MRNHIFVFCILFFSSCVQQEGNLIVGRSYVRSSTDKLIKTIVIGQDTFKEWHNYFENGKVFLKFYTKNDQVDGTFTSYYENGWILTIGNYDNGAKSGLWTSYESPNKIRNAGNYRMGEKDGVWNYYFPSGNLEKIVEYSNGKEVKVLIGNSLPLPE